MLTRFDMLKLLAVMDMRFQPVDLLLTSVTPMIVEIKNVFARDTPFPPIVRPIFFIGELTWRQFKLSNPLFQILAFLRDIRIQLRMLGDVSYWDKPQRHDDVGYGLVMVGPHPIVVAAMPSIEPTNIFGVGGIVGFVVLT